LLPGESRKLTVRYHLADVMGKDPTVLLDGWNVALSK